MSKGLMKPGPIERLTAEHVLAVVAEWAAIVGSLTYAYDRSGTKAVGFTSLAIVFPHVVGAPLVASAMVRWRALTLRRVSFAAQSVLFAIAAAVGAAGGPLVVVIGAIALAQGATGVLRPAAAMLMPWLARSTRELVRGNLLSSYTESASSLVGPLLAAGLVALGGTIAPIVGCAVATLLALILSITTRGRGPEAAGEGGDRGGIRAIGRRLRERPWTAWLFGVLATRHFVLGAIDILIVFIAYEALDLGATGPGFLHGFMGFGAVVSIAVITFVSRRGILGPAVLGGLAAAALACLALAASTRAVPVYVALFVVGLCASLLNNLGRMLLQRSVDPSALGAMFAGLGIAGGVGEMAGSGFAQLLFAIGGLESALIGVAAVAGVFGLAGIGPIRLADRRSDVPVVEMSLMRDLPLFEALPPITLEGIAREATRQVVTSGEQLIVEGSSGDTFYVVVTGSFDVFLHGEHVRTIGRGGGFGEVALLANVPRTATVTASTSAEVLVIHRDPFLDAVTGHQRAFNAAQMMVAGNRFSGDNAPSISFGSAADSS